MSGWWSSITNAASKTLSYTGLTGEYEQPPYDCAWPNKPFTPATAAEASARHHQQIDKLINDKEWQLMSYKDPEGGDLHLMSKTGIGCYHFVKATFSVPNCVPDKFASIVLSDDIEVRKSYSADCTGLKVLAKPSETSCLLHVTYTAPPPVVGRDFVFLIDQKKHSDGTLDFWGCSMSSDLCADGSTGLVRGTSLWGWRLTPVGEHLFATYVGCFDPRGWAPTFLISWLKSAASKEMIALRSVSQGKKAEVHASTLEDIGVTEDQAKKEYEEQEKKRKEAEAKK